MNFVVKIVLSICAVLAQFITTDIYAFSKELAENAVNNADKAIPITDALASKNTYEPNMFSLVLSLTIVIVLIIITGWLFIKFNKFLPEILKKKADFDNSNKINILSTTNLGNNKSLHIIEVKNRQFLVGSTVNEVNLIAEVTAKEQKM
ncbi:MAG: flagellar biosynthetic protein FliO [Candidatus Gastranaerophilales bacterium]|nr:flagellar biosynthetic protein FliO [Candidatus Gastranaerophilales bacterium]